jgi:hypothetical protein
MTRLGENVFRFDCYRKILWGAGLLVIPAWISYMIVDAVFDLQSFYVTAGNKVGAVIVFLILMVIPVLFTIRLLRTTLSKHIILDNDKGILSICKITFCGK